MKNSMMLCATALVAVSLNTATASSKDEVTAAAKKLGEKANYSWKTIVAVPEGSQFRPGPSEGKTEKHGFTAVTSSFGENTMQTILRGEKGAMTNQEGAWQSLAEVENEEGFGRFRAIMARSLRTPAVQAADLAAGAKDLKKEGDTYSGDLTEDGAKALMRFGRGGDGPTVSNAKGSVKFWLKNGELLKYEFKVQGKITFNDNEREIDRTTTVEIKDVGTTKVTVPDEAKKKLS